MTRRIVAKTFPSGPGYEVFLDETFIGSIGKHYRERNWWWQVGGKLGGLDATPVRADGMESTKPKALAALFAKWAKIGAKK